MYDVIGHEVLRERLKAVQGSFAVLGPPGVGKKGIVHEWAGDRVDETFESMSIQQARQLSEKAYVVKNLTALIDGDAVKNWDPLLRPIEEGTLRVATWATKLIYPISSRMSTFRAGYLSEAETTKILAKTFPTFGPRPWLAKALMGSFEGFKDIYAAVHVFESVNACLSDKVFPRVVRDAPFAAFQCIRLACLAELGHPNLPWSSAALASIPRTVSWEVLKAPYPHAKQEARNVSTLFFAGVTGGRLG